MKYCVGLKYIFCPTNFFLPKQKYYYLAVFFFFLFISRLYNYFPKCFLLRFSACKSNLYVDCADIGKLDMFYNNAARN